MGWWVLAYVAQPVTAVQALTWVSAKPWIPDLLMAGDKEGSVGNPGRGTWEQLETGLEPSNF